MVGLSNQAISKSSQNDSHRRSEPAKESWGLSRKLLKVRLGPTMMGVGSWRYQLCAQVVESPLDVFIADSGCPEVVSLQGSVVNRETLKTWHFPVRRGNILYVLTSKLRNSCKGSF
jgi:hypothetical protein